MIYHETEHGVLHCGDCLDILPTLADKSVDLVLTDPPYGVNLEYDNYQDTRENLIALIPPLLMHCNRISPLSAITCGIVNINLYPDYYWVMAWVYDTTSSTGKFGFTQWQPIVMYGQDPYLKNGLGRNVDVIRSTGLDRFKSGHPCSKPEKFWTTLLLRLSINKGDTIIDPFGGSGTTAIACIRQNRKYILIEKEEKYCEIAARRIETELDQTVIDFP